jgi:hypothetical protein
MRVMGKDERDGNGLKGMVRMREMGKDERDG